MYGSLKDSVADSDPYVGQDPILYDSNSQRYERTLSITNTEMCMDESMYSKNITGMYREIMQPTFYDNSKKFELRD